MSCATRLATRTEDAGVLPDEFPASSGFVGRQRELGELRAALEETLAGQGTRGI